MSARILYIDDEEDLRILVQSQLELEGFSVDLAGNGISAIDMIARTSYDVILLDLHLPDMSGADIVEELNRRGLHPHLVILSGDSSEEAQSRCIALGVKHFLHKPFHFRDLISSIGRAPAQNAKQDDDDESTNAGRTVG